MNLAILLLFCKMVVWLRTAISNPQKPIKNTLQCALFLTMVTHYSTLCQHFIGFTRIKTNTEVFTVKSISRIYLTNTGLHPMRGVLVIKEEFLLVRVYLLFERLSLFGAINL